MTDLYQEFQNSRFYHEARIDRRSADALIGIATGLTADGNINQQEAEFLKGWIEGNLTNLDDPVVNILYRRLADMLSDQILEPDESTELLDLLQQFSGIQIGNPKSFTTPSTLPLNHPAPQLNWPNQVFVFTGIMAFGPRCNCEALVLEKGGLIGGGVSKKVNYLVVGSIGNEQWLHSSYGNKIKKAVELRENGAKLAIISEDHWQQALFGQ